MPAPGRPVKAVRAGLIDGLTGPMTPLWKLGPTVPLGSPFDPGARHDVVIVGAGITGLSTAVMLADAGLDVAVIDSGSVAELATGGNTGKLLVQASEA